MADYSGSEEEKNKELHETKDIEPKDVTLEEALKMYDDSKRYIDTGFRGRWDKYYKIYRGERVDPNYIGTISVTNREPHTIIETLVANIAGGVPKFHFVPCNEEQNKDTSVLNGILDYYLEFNDMNLKNQIWVRDMLLYGTGIIHVTWREGKLWIENIPLRDFFVDPSATDFVKTQRPARYAGFEYLANKEDLRGAMIYDADERKMVPKYEKIEEAGDVPSVDGEGFTMDKKFKDLFNGSTLENASTDQMHVIFIYDLVSGKIMEIGNRKEFIYKKDSHLQRAEETREVEVYVDGQKVMSTQTLDEIKPFIPMAALRDYQDSSLFFGEGEMAVIAGDSELLNDYESMDADNNAYQNTPMYQIDPQFADMAPEIETIAGAVYPIPKGALTPIEIPQLGQDLEIKKDTIANRMRRETAADEAVQGVAQQKGRVTATEVDRQLSQANQRFSTKLTNLGSGGYSQLGSIAFKMFHLFLPAQTAVRIIGPMGVEFKNFDPWEYNGEYEPHVELDSEIKKKQLEVGMKMNQIFQIIENSQVLDPVEKTRFIIQHVDPNFTDEKFNAMLAKPAPPQPPDPKESLDLSKIYELAGPFVKAQIEVMAGLNPDPAHQGEQHLDMMRKASEAADLADPRTDSANKPLPGIDPLTGEKPVPEPVGATA